MLDESAQIKLFFHSFMIISLYKAVQLIHHQVTAQSAALWHQRPDLSYTPKLTCSVCRMMSSLSRHNRHFTLKVTWWTCFNNKIIQITAKYQTLFYRVSKQPGSLTAFWSTWYLSHLMTKPTKWALRPAKIQISLGICPVWSVFAVCMKKAWVPLSAQWRLWSERVDAQADPSHRWAHCHFVGFVVRRLICVSTFLAIKETEQIKI